MLINLYSLFSNILYLPILLFFIFRFFFSKETLRSLYEKFGSYKQIKPYKKIIWINAVSIGESLSVLPIVKMISKKYPDYRILITTSTLTSAYIVKSRFPKNIIHQFTPIDIQFVVRKFYNYWKPDIGFFLESEFWPNLLNESKKRKLKLISLNSRISKKTFNHWSKFPNTAITLLSSFKIYFAQDKTSENRLKMIGVKEVLNYGNIKFLSKKLPINKKNYETFKKNLKEKEIILLASSHPGEESKIIQEFKNLKKQKKNLFLIIVPRHPERCREIEYFFKSNKLNFSKRSISNYISMNRDCLIVDTFGELGLFYNLAKIVIMGGSFIPHGGQNPIEASHFNCCIIIGPHYENFYDIVESYKEKQGIIQVKNFNELSMTIKDLLNNPNKRQIFIKKNNVVRNHEKKKVGKIWSKIDKIIEKL